MKKKSTPPLIKHQDHEIIIVASGNSTHSAKYHCVTCNKFVAWLKKDEAELAASLGLINELDLSI